MSIMTVIRPSACSASPCVSGVSWLLSVGLVSGVLAAGLPASGEEPAASNDPAIPSLDEELEQFAEPGPQLKFEKVLTLSRHESAISAVAISADGSRAVTCSTDGDCRAWNLRTGQQIGRLQEELTGKQFCVAISPDAKHGLVGGEFEAVHVWNLETGELVFTHEAPKAAVTHLAVSTDGAWITAADASPALHRYPLLGGEGVSTPPIPLGQPFRWLGVMPDASFALAGASVGPSVVFVFPGEQNPGNISGITLNWQPVTYASTSKESLVLGTGAHRAVQLQLITEGARVGVNYIELESRIERMRCTAITPDDRLVVTLDHTGALDVRHSTAPAAYSSFRIPISYATASAISADGLTVAYGHHDGTVSLWRLPQVPESAHYRFVRALRRDLERQDYDRLEDLASRLKGDKTPFFWKPELSKYQALVLYLGYRNGLKDDPDENDKRLEGWVAKRPDSTAARLALASRYILRGWAARGSGFAHTVSPQGWKTFHESLEKAWELLEPVGASDNVPDDFYRQAFEIAKGEGWDREKVDELLEKLMEQHPLCLSAHQAVAEYLLPRWHGEPGDCEAYARRVADRIGGDSGDAVYARIAARLRRFHSGRRFFEDLDFDYDRIQNGWRHLGQVWPDESRPLNESLMFAWMRDDKDAARDGFRKIDRQRDLWSLQTWGSRQRFLEARSWALRPENTNQK